MKAITAGLLVPATFLAPVPTAHAAPIEREASIAETRSADAADGNKRFRAHDTGVVEIA
ncbi:hypothetical protein ABTW96_26065 [Nocardia beijingensis]|uniref:hypothetical protein n=1 Tax=Nocardia beijingensis TaxID=95162 RepID=UPI0033322676